MRDINIRSKFHYDGELGLEAYKNYLKGIVDDNSIVMYLKRYVIMYIKSNYKHLGDDVCGDLVQAVLTELWKVIVARKIPETNIFVYHSFINTVMRRAASKEFNTVYGHSPREIPYEMYESRYFNRDITPKDIEDQIFLEELPNALRKRISKKSRFQNKYYQEAIAYILERILTQTRIVPDYLKRQFGFNNSVIRFLTEHVYVLLRIELYDIRLQIKFSDCSEKRDVLWAEFERNIWTTH